jgi:hypothetical protein
MLELWTKLDRGDIGKKEVLPVVFIPLIDKEGSQEGDS